MALNTMALAETGVKLVDEKPTPAQAKPAQPELTVKEQADAISTLRRMHLQIPIEGFNITQIKGSFNELRGGEAHHAADFLAPRNTPVHAVTDGPLAKIFESKAGGHTLYQLDPTQKFVFYYAHLEKYADGLTEGQALKRGEVIGYVGTSGNAPPNTPHLHLSIGVLQEQKSWWKAIDVDPYQIFGP
ncbi:MAG: M23 family metallopeptidase [Candidatus Obscuribacterales bacterium]|nr:M23 family metallopeptidase [Candidatus Obscuribacterales bacterium]